MKLRFPPVWTAAAVVAIGASAFASIAADRFEQGFRTRIGTATSRLAQAKGRANGEDAEASRATLERVRSRAARFQSDLMSQAAANKAIADLEATGWRVIEGETEPNTEWVRRRVTLSRSGAPIDDWPRLLEATQQLSKQQGLRIRSFQLATIPDEAKPVFTRFELAIDLFLKPSTSASE